MKEEPRDIIVPIRMNFEERNKIKMRAEKTGKPFSTFIRDSALLNFSLPITPKKIILIKNFLFFCNISL